MTQTVSLGGATGGKLAIELPLVGFGTWRLRGQEAYGAVRYALEVGYRHVDTATVYGNEAEVGRAVRDSGVPRDEVFVTTKLPPERAGQERETLSASLDALGLDHVDLWLVHWPPNGTASPQVWERFLEVQRTGLARVVGVSNYSVAQIDELIEVDGVAPAVNQVPWSPSDHDPEFLGACRKRGVQVEGYSGLKRSQLDDPTLAQMAQRHGVSVAQVILRWHVQHGIAVIPKSAHKDRIAANLDVWGFELTPDDMAAVDALGVR